MKRYLFQSKLTEAEVSSRINILPQISFSTMTKANTFCGEVVNGRIHICRVPNALFSNFSFFCGKIVTSKNGTSIIGGFAPPIKLVIIPYCIICVLLLFFASITGFIAGIIGCFFLQLIQGFFLSINTRSKKDLISFITNSLDSTMLQ